MRCPVVGDSSSFLFGIVMSAAAMPRERSRSVISSSVPVKISPVDSIAWMLSPWLVMWAVEFICLVFFQRIAQRPKAPASLFIDNLIVELNRSQARFSQLLQRVPYIVKSEVAGGFHEQNFALA
jgi:hypothetical protein